MRNEATRDGSRPFSTCQYFSFKPGLKSLSLILIASSCFALPAFAADAAASQPAASNPFSIQAALDANPGRMISVPSGDHWLTNAVVIRHHGSGLYGFGRLIQANPNASVIEIRGANDVRLRDLTLTRPEGNETARAAAVEARDCTNLSLANLRVLDKRAPASALSLRQYGDLGTDFTAFSNLSDANLRILADEGWRPKSPDLVAKDARFNDGSLVTREVGGYKPNAWGLHDMHGNAAEWTRSDYGGNGKKVIRGGSWRDRPRLCRSASRWAYGPCPKVFNVCFRVIIESKALRVATSQP